MTSLAFITDDSGHCLSPLLPFSSSFIQLTLRQSSLPQAAADHSIGQAELKQFTKRLGLPAKGGKSACFLPGVNAVSVEPSLLKERSDFSLFED